MEGGREEGRARGNLASPSACRGHTREPSLRTREVRKDRAARDAGTAGKGSVSTPLSHEPPS